MKNDRIQAAWELRRDIHTWLVANPHSVMAEIFQAFADRNHETVRKAVIRMRYDGDVAMLGRRGLEGRYTALSRAIKPVAMVRQKLADGGRSTIAKAMAAAMQSALDIKAMRAKPAAKRRARGSELSIDKLRVAEQRRQAILDVLIAQPLAKFSAIERALPAVDPMHLRGAIANMVKKREIAASGSPRDRSYIALVDTTISAEQVRAARLEAGRMRNYRVAGDARPARTESAADQTPQGWVGCSIKYKSGDIPEIARHQRGQGAAARLSGIGSGMYSSAKW